MCECESLSLSENLSFFALLQTGPRPRRPSPSGIIPVNIRLYALQLYGRVPYNWGIFLARGRENAAFDCLHTTKWLNCISLVRSWSDPAEGVSKPATWTSDQVLKGVSQQRGRLTECAKVIYNRVLTVRCAPAPVQRGFAPAGAAGRQPRERGGPRHVYCMPLDTYRRRHGVSYHRAHRQL